MNKQGFKLTAAAVAIAALGVAGGYWLGQHRGSGSAPTAPAPDGRKALYWYDPMVPNQHFDKPGKSPFMDMQLVPKYADEGGTAGEPAGVRIDPGVLQNLGVRLAAVERRTQAQPLLAIGSVTYNERDVAVVQARAAGFVQRVYARAPGDVVTAGAPLADLLVPEWAGAQGEFLALAKSGDPQLAAAARQRLLLLGMPSDLIARVEHTGQTHPIVTVSTPIGGVIQSLDVRAGMTLPMGATLARVNGLATVWLDIALPEAQADQVNVGKTVAAQFNAYPGESFSGRVLAVLPETNTDTRTLRVRVELPNPGGRLKPGMYAQVRLDGGDALPALWVPSEAVIRTGRRTVVIVAQTEREGTPFLPVEIVPGREAGGQTEVVKGLDAGQKVVASGQFLIDSEASLSGVLTRLTGTAPAAAPKAPATPAAVALHTTTGKIEALTGAEITLSHGPVKSLGWGPMTMPFKLAKPELAAGLKPGDTVDFGFRQGDGGFVIEQLKKTWGAQ